MPGTGNVPILGWVMTAQMSHITVAQNSLCIYIVFTACVFFKWILDVLNGLFVIGVLIFILTILAFIYSLQYFQKT